MPRKADKHEKTEETRNGISLRAHSPAENIIGNFWSPEPLENKFVLLLVT